MKITEVQQPSSRALFEAIDQENNTGFKTEDLVRIVQEDSSNRWSKPLTAEELLELLSAGD
jgi:hypothetical protein